MTHAESVAVAEYLRTKQVTVCPPRQAHGQFRIARHSWTTYHWFPQGSRIA